MDTTAGSTALVGAKVPGDAHLVSLLKEAGAIILGKANLSQWSYLRDGDHLPSGWSTTGGGQITCPYVSIFPSTIVSSTKVYKAEIASTVQGR